MTSLDLTQRAELTEREDRERERRERGEERGEERGGGERRVALGWPGVVSWGEISRHVRVSRTF